MWQRFKQWRYKRAMRLKEEHAKARALMEERRVLREKKRLERVAQFEKKRLERAAQKEVERKRQEFRESQTIVILRVRRWQQSNWWRYPPPEGWQPGFNCSGGEFALAALGIVSMITDKPVPIQPVTAEEIAKGTQLSIRQLEHFIPGFNPRRAY